MYCKDEKNLCTYNINMEQAPKNESYHYHFIVITKLDDNLQSWINSNQ